MAKPFVDSGASSTDVTAKNSVVCSCCRRRMECVFFFVLTVLASTLMIFAIVGFVFVSSDSKNISSAEISVKYEIELKLLIEVIWQMDLDDLLNGVFPKITTGFI